MPNFQVPKSFDDIKEAKFAPDGVYKFIVTRIEMRENKKQTGNNLEVDLCVTGESEDLNGITQTLYLPMPNPTDEGRTTKQGQPMVDWKLANIKETVESLGGKVEGSSFDIPENAMCKSAMVTLVNPESGRKYNRLEGRLMSYKAGGSKPKVS